MSRVRDKYQTRGVGRRQSEEPSQNLENFSGLLDFQWRALFHFYTGKDLPQYPHPKYQGIWSQRQIPRVSVPLTQPAPLEPFSQVINGKECFCPLEV